MGNVFSGQTEDLLLYVVGPLLAFALVVTVLALWARISSRLAAGADSWREPPAEANSPHYRTPAAFVAPAGAPRSVRWLARTAAAWGAATLAVWSFVTICVAAFTGPCVAMLVPITAAVASVLVIRTSLALPAREHPTAAARIDRARVALLVHHVALFVLGTGLFGLLMLSELYFWNSPTPRGSTRTTWMLAIYAVLVIAPSAMGVGLERWLRSVRPLYAAA